MSEEKNKLIIRDSQVEVLPPETLEERKRRELREAIERYTLGDPIFTPATLISLAISAAFSGISYLITRALTPKPQPLQQGKMSGYLTIATQIGSLWPEVYGGDPGDGYGGAWVGPIVISTSKMAKIVQVSRQPVGGGKGGSRSSTQEVETTLYYFPYIALGWGRGPLRLIQEMANADILYDLFGEASTYEGEAASVYTGATQIVSYPDQTHPNANPSGGREATLGVGASVQWNTIKSYGAATRQATLSYRTTVGISMLVSIYVNGVLHSSPTLPTSNEYYSKYTFSAALNDGLNTIKIVNNSPTYNLGIDYLRCFPGHADPTQPTGGLNPTIPPDPPIGPIVPNIDPRAPYTIPKARHDAVLDVDEGGVQTGTLSLANNAGIAVYPGTSTQLPDPTMQAAIDSQFGANSTPAYRGKCVEVDTNFYLTRWGNTFPNRKGLLEHEVIKTLGQIDAHFCQRVKMLYYDFSYVGSIAVRGLRVIGGGRFKPKDVLLNCAHFFNTYFAEVDGQLISRVRGSVVRAAITDADLGWTEGDKSPSTISLLDVVEPDQTEIPQSLTVSYMSLDRNGDPDSQTAIRQITPNVEAKTLNFENITSLPDEARAVAERELFLEEVGKQVRFTTDWSKLYWNVGDVVPANLSDGFSYMVELTKRPSSGIGVLTWEGVLIDTPIFTQPAVGVAGIFEMPPAPIPASTFFGLIDSMLLRDKDETNNRGSVIYIYGCPRTNSKQDWKGWTLFFYKVGWERLAHSNLPATCGRLVAVNGVAGALLSPVNDIAVKDTTNTFTVDLFTTDDFQPVLESITTADVNNGAGGVLLGDECIQPETWTRVGGYPSRWTASNLWRARRETDYALGTHVPYERFALLNEAVQAVPYSADDLNQVYDFAGASDGQSLEDAARIKNWMWAGRSLQPRKVTNLIVVRDGSYDWLIQFKGRPRPLEEPAEYAVEIWTLDGLTLKRTLNVFPSQGVASMFAEMGTLIIPGDVYDPDPKKPPQTYQLPYLNKNNLIAPTSPSTYAYIRSLQEIEHSGVRIDVTADVPRDGSGNELADTTFLNQFGLIPASLETPNPAYSNVPFQINWWTPSAPGDPADKYLRVYNYTTLTYGESSYGMGSSANIRAGEMFTLLLIGNECRAYRNYREDSKPLAVMNLTPSMFPLRVFASGSGGSDMLNFMIRGLDPSTIYSSRQQIEDFSATQSRIRLKVYQKTKYPGIKGLVTDYDSIGVTKYASASSVGGYNFNIMSTLIRSANPTPGDFNSFGAWTQLDSSLAQSISWVLFSAEAEGGGSSRVRVELGMGAPGAEVPIARLVVGNASAPSSGGSAPASFPYTIPAGTRLVVRAAASGGELPLIEVAVSLFY